MKTGLGLDVDVLRSFLRRATSIANRLTLLFIVVWLIVQPAWAQNRCRVPKRLPAAQSMRVSPDQVRAIPVTDYSLALSWSPQYCRTRGTTDHLQCGADTDFGFILHGLWPEGEGQSWPQYCRPVGPIPADVSRRAFCATPSVDLQQHEWAKHGSCMTESPAAYFEAGTALFNALKWPDMDRLSRSRTNVSGLTFAFVAANPGLRQDMIRVALSNAGWLEELRICLDTDFRPTRCPRDAPGAREREQVKIWRRSG
jgi:ribonuclease T2